MNYLIYGNSYNLVDEQIKKIIGKANYKIIYLSDVNINTLLEDINYDSMFEEKKVIIIKDFEILFEGKKENEKNINNLIDYLNNPNELNTLIFVSKETISSKTKINKELLSKLNVINTPIIKKSYELSKIFGDVIKKNGFAISQNTLNNFCEKCASNYDIALMEFNKLKDIKGNNHLITDIDIENIVSNYNINDSFTLKDAIINKDILKANKIMDELENSKMELVPLVVMLEKEYELILSIKMLTKNIKSNEEIGKMLNNTHPYRIKLLRDASLKYTEKELINLIHELCNIDLRLVTEDNLGYDEVRKFITML